MDERMITPTWIAPWLRVALTSIGPAALVHCSETSPSDNGASDGGVTIECSTGTPSVPVARPICTTSNPFGVDDASSGMACTSVADCADAGAAHGLHGCLAGQCSFDRCLTDSDCPTGQACGCSTEIGGNAVHFNECIAAQCRTSADCSSGGACSPTNASSCGSVTGFYCHSSADQCATDADCTCDDPGAGPLPGQCAFSPQLGHFACQTRSTCNG